MNEPTDPVEGPGAAETDAVRIERIAAVLDDRPEDEALVRHAADLAAVCGASLSLVTVVEQGDLGRVAAFFSLSRERAAARLLDEERARREARLSQLHPSVPFRLDVRLGKPFLEIIRHVQEGRIDVLMKTADRLPVVAHPTFASTDQHLLRKCPSALWLLPQRAPAQVRSVVAAVDVDDLAAPAGAAAQLNLRIVSTAARLAGIHGATLHLLHVWEASGEALVHRWAGNDAAARRYVDDVRERRRRGLEALREHALRLRDPAGCRLAAVEAHLVRGEARDVVPDQARRQRADVLVMGTIARTGVAGWLIGNTAEDILNSIDCAVVTVKPPGYVSPVQP